MSDDVIIEDPFTLIYTKLWECVEQHEPLVEMVRVGNRIQFVQNTEDHDPRFPIVTYGNTPSLMLVPDFFNSELNFDNTQSLISRNWNWVIRTGERLLNRSLFPVEYQLYKAMQKARKVLMKLKFEGDELVKTFEITRGSATIPHVDQKAESPLNRSWLSVWTITTDLNIAR